MGTSSHPDTLADLLDSIGAAGGRLNDLDAVEAGAGNISVAVDWDLDVASVFDVSREIDLPWEVPALAGYTVLVTGAGCRLRDLASSPEDNLGAVRLHDGGRTGTLWVRGRGNVARPTSEFNSHLAAHADRLQGRAGHLHALIHAQPPHLTLLSHLPAYQGTEKLNRAILRWEPETIMQLPEGVAHLPFLVPGSRELMENTVARLRDHQVVLWGKHGVMARSDVSPLAACDKIEYAETGARYEYLDLVAGGRGEGLSAEELHRVVEAFQLPTTLY